jgi:SAM-dependent methyltransferase
MTRWPKTIPALSEAEQAMRVEFLRLWHEHLPRRHRRVERFNHASRVLRASAFEGCRTLEIGAGLGEHLRYEHLASQEYTALEIRPDFVQTIETRFPGVKTIRADIQRRIDTLADGAFDRVLAIHVLEHLPDLPAALIEIRRVLDPAGRLVAVIPCEGGLAYQLARRVSAQRLFERTFRAPYGPIIRSEHVNSAREIIDELSKVFVIRTRQFWPLRVPLVHPNLVVALSCVPRTS